ncbi:MAG: porin, partial [Lutibacter sp.]
YLMDAFVTYHKYNWARISAGTFKQPFSLEVATPCNALTTINRSIVADQLVAPQRDFGIMLLGGNKHTQFTYAVALMNGRGLNAKDNNSKKDIIGRITYKPISNLQIGGSFRYGYPNNTTDTRKTYGLEMTLNLNNLHIQGEYIYDEGDYNRAASGGCGSEPVELGEKRDGAYIMLSYDTKWKIQPVFKYEYFDPNIDVKKIGYQEMMTIKLSSSYRNLYKYRQRYVAGANSNKMVIKKLLTIVKSFFLKNHYF